MRYNSPGCPCLCFNIGIGHMDTLNTPERFTLRDENTLLNIQSCLFNYVLILSGDGYIKTFTFRDIAPDIMTLCTLHFVRHKTISL